MPYRPQHEAAAIANAGTRNGRPSAGNSVASRPMSSLNPSANISSTSAGPRNVWKNGGGPALVNQHASNAAPSLLKSAVNKAAQAVAPPPQTQTADDQLASQMNKMALKPNTGAFNPSEGPTPSTVSTNWRFHGANESQATNRSVRQVVNTMVCKLSGLTRRDFRLGEVISLPFHTANTNPDVDPNDRRLSLTKEGPAYSKRRMMVILWIHQDNMFCLPLYSFECKGIKGKPQYLRREYVSMKNVGDKNFENQGKYTPIEVKNRSKPMHPMTAVHLTGGMKVGCNEDITMVGRLEQESHRYLVGLWEGLNQEAQGERWRS